MIEIDYLPAEGLALVTVDGTPVGRMTYADMQRLARQVGPALHRLGQHQAAEADRQYLHAARIASGFEPSRSADLALDVPDICI